MGRWRATFMVPGVPAAVVLQQVAAACMAEHLRPAPSPAPNQLYFSKGDEAVAGRTMVGLQAWDVQGGTSLTLEAWISTWLGDIDANPTRIYGMLPRRRLWKKVKRICAAAGLRAEGAFHHSG